MKKELNKILQDLLLNEEMLYDFALDCIRKLYPNDKYALACFEEMHDSFESTGYYSLEYIDKQVKGNEKFKQKAKESKK